MDDDAEDRKRQSDVVDALAELKARAQQVTEDAAAIDAASDAIYRALRRMAYLSRYAHNVRRYGQLAVRLGRSMEEFSRAATKIGVILKSDGR